jgi:hypothetical protein
MAKTRPTTVEQITGSILILRGHRVLLDAELAAIAAILSAIRELMSPPAPNRRSIGFTAKL